VASDSELSVVGRSLSKANILKKALLKVKSR
jgi:hypothetical protein